VVLVLQDGGACATLRPSTQSRADFRKGLQMCDICKTQTGLLNPFEKTKARLSGWVGIDFYNEICSQCFTKEKENI
jgi:hypothetical protein